MLSLSQKKLLPLPVIPVVVGAGRATGKECVNALLKRGMAVRAVARSPVTSKGKDVAYEAADASLLTQMYADVTKPETLAPVIKGARGVIFAASSSKKGGNPELVDYQGLVNTAKLCIENNVERLVIVSSGGVSKPSSSIYQLLNLFGQIMFWKIKGEDEVRALYAAPSTPPTLSYTIVRPGGLTEGPPVGPAAIELNQGDGWSGRIARADVADICVESLLYPDPQRVTLEAYYADTRKPLQEVGLSNILKLKSDVAPEVKGSGKERRGATWGELFTGLRRDTQIKQQGSA